MRVISKPSSLIWGYLGSEEFSERIFNAIFQLIKLTMYIYIFASNSSLQILVGLAQNALDMVNKDSTNCEFFTWLWVKMVRFERMNTD